MSSDEFNQPQQFTPALDSATLQGAAEIVTDPEFSCGLIRLLAANSILHKEVSAGTDKANRTAVENAIGQLGIDFGQGQTSDPIERMLIVIAATESWKAKKCAVQYALATHRQKDVRYRRMMADESLKCQAMAVKILQRYRMLRHRLQAGNP